MMDDWLQQRASGMAVAVAKSLPLQAQTDLPPQAGAKPAHMPVSPKSGKGCAHSPCETLDAVEQLQALRVQAASYLVSLEDHTHSIGQVVQAGLVL